MTGEELENWERVQYRMDEEGFVYCFEGYSRWEEIKDEEFHHLRKQFLESMHNLRFYIDNKVDEVQVSPMSPPTGMLFYNRHK